MKNNKYLYLWIVQARTSQRGRGWQDIDNLGSYRHARLSLKACQGASKAKHRLIKRREANPEYKETLKP